MKLITLGAVTLAALLGGPLSAQEQAPAEPPPVQAPMFSDAQLDQLLGPIALYPDPLIAEILPAATFPTQIVMADRYLNDGGDPNQIDQQPWDPSVRALARYPTVLKWMDDNLNWTTQLGQAFVNQQPDVMNSVQRLRTTASNLGNLQSTPQEQVTTDDGQIQIVPADPDEIYVPEYQPDQVYYDQPYGTPFITYSIGWPIGPWLMCDFDWRHRHLVEWDHDHPRPADWWHQPNHERELGNTTVWRPENHPGANVGNRGGDRGWSTRPSPLVVRGQPERPMPPQPGHEFNTPRPAPGPLTPPREERPNNTVRPAPAPVISQHVDRPANVVRPAPAPVEHFQPAPRPEENGAFIGIQSSHETQGYSSRGQQSMQTAPRSAPEPRSAPAPHYSAPSGGGGGGGHSSGKQR